MHVIKYYPNLECKSSIIKLYDHISLDIARIEYTKKIDRKTEEARKELEINKIKTEDEIAELLLRSNELKEDLDKQLKNSKDMQDKIGEQIETTQKLENNIKEATIDIENVNIYRNISEYTNIYSYACMGILKNALNNYEEKIKNIKEFGDKIEFKKEKSKIYVLTSIYKLKELFLKSRGGKIKLPYIMVATNNKESLIEKLKRELIEQKNEYKICEYLILEMEKDENTIVYNTTEEFKDIYTEILLPNIIITFDPFLVEKTIEKCKQKEDLEVYKDLKQNVEIENTEYDYNNDIIKNIESIRAEIRSEKSIHEYLRDLALEGNAFEKNIFDEKDKIETIINNSIDIGIYLKKYVKLLNDIEEIEEKISKTKILEEKLKNEDYTNDTNSEIKDIEKAKEELKLELEEKEKIKDELYSQLKSLKDRYKESFLNILEYIKYIKLEEKRYVDAGIDDKEKVKLFELEKILRKNKNKSDKMVEDISDLIRKQQKYAKIGAETNSKYSSLIDGFKIKQEAEKLRKILTDMYSDYKEYYFNKLNKKLPNIEYERKLTKILEVAEKAEIFLNYIYNPKNSKQRTDLNRFDELILIEENEIKRKITKEVDTIIANANLLIIDEEIDSIETKRVLEKIFDMIIGKRKKDKERVLKLEELAEEVDAKLRQKYTINRNYKIHDVLAKIMIFKSENLGDSLVKELVDKITVIEKAIAKNFVISEEKVLNKIEELKMLKLPVVVDDEKETDIEYELALMRHKYEYDNIYTDEEVKYVDTTANEIKQIIEYIKLSI